MKVLLCYRAIAAMISELESHPNAETGGVFIGKETNGDFWILDSVFPGPNSKHGNNSFEYDSDFLNYTINKLLKMYEDEIMVVGIWHQHLSGSSSFSVYDDIMNYKFVDKTEKGIVSAIVNRKAGLDITFYYVDKKHEYQRIEYELHSYDLNKIGRYKTELDF